MTEGFIHTRDRVRYIIRMGALALISEPFFDMAIYGTWFYADYQNMILTLWIGLLMLTALELSVHPASRFWLFWRAAACHGFFAPTTMFLESF